MKAMTYRQQVVNSALWAAYGDALGFITELRDNERSLHSRVSSEGLTQTVSWRRRVGGKFGVSAHLPAGCYSDDTELRLATARAIRSDRSFNVEAFAKMELPVWTSYALGAGRGTKSAATALAHDGINWFSNFFVVPAANYLSSGGNGAAMRIQPHVLAADSNATFAELAAPIVANAVTTHGHIRGIGGAVFHAMCLNHARSFRSTPNADDWRNIVEKLSEISDVVSANSDLRTFWLPYWEKESGQRFDHAIRSVQSELIEDITLLEPLLRMNDPKESYHLGLDNIHALKTHLRGSGTKTALLAIFLAYLFQDHGPEAALICAANSLLSDTDSIATMAGAILGLLASESPQGELMDKGYIIAQAERIANISSRETALDTNYPNLLTWKPPKTQQDSVVVGDNGLEVLVLGKVTHEGEKFETSPSQHYLWQWLELESGQSVLAKRRRKPAKILRSQRSLPPEPATAFQSVKKDGAKQLSLVEHYERHRSPPNLDDLTRIAIESKFDAKTIGEHLLLVSSLPNGVEHAIAYSAIIAKARLARIQKSA